MKKPMTKFEKLVEEKRQKWVKILREELRKLKKKKKKSYD